MSDKKSTIIHVEDNMEKGGTYLQGEPNEMLLILIMAMQANPFIRILFERAVFLAKIAEKKKLNGVKDATIDLGDEAEIAFKAFVDPEYKKKSG